MAELAGRMDSGKADYSMLPFHPKTLEGLGAAYADHFGREPVPGRCVVDDVEVVRILAAAVHDIYDFLYGVDTIPSKPRVYVNQLRMNGHHILNSAAAHLSAALVYSVYGKNPYKIGIVQPDENAGAFAALNTEVLNCIVRVLEAGATKYGRFNYHKGFKVTGLMSAALRHIKKHFNGEVYDDVVNPDKPSDIPTNEPHLGCALVNILFALNQIHLGRGEDDRAFTY